jgi:molybdenum cofactor cytidylyltransferase
MSNTGIIILAAGSSSRMDEPKQLLSYKNKTFLQHIVSEAKFADLDPIVCVTGFQAERVGANISGMGADIVFNADWAEGMGSGIASGIKHILHTDLDAIILAVSDQPHVSADLFRKMETLKASSGKGIVACAYAGTLGTPVLFGKDYFDRLKLLNGNEGAKKIVQLNLNDVSSIEFEKGSVDIDTKQDYEKLISEI